MFNSFPMRAKALTLFVFLILCEGLFAQNYYLQYSYDTLGNRSRRVRGVQTRESEADGQSTDTLLSFRSDSISNLDTESMTSSRLDPSESEPEDHGPLIKTKAEKEAYIREIMAQTASLKPIIDSDRRTRDITSYDVGAIPMQYDVSPTGARTYSIPIATAPDIKYAPSLAMVYNSQGGFGYGGYGWDLSGLSSITLASKSLYYDDKIKGADAADTSAVFMLDGIRLVRNIDLATSSSYPLVTARGHILAAPVKNSAGYVRYFNVLYPNGVSATYGSTSLNLNSQLLSYPMVESINLNGDRIQYVYSFDSTDGSNYLTSVRYGFDSSGNAAGEIEWQYTDDQYYQYYAGKKLWRKPRIGTLVSKSGGQILYRYTFTYTTSASVPGSFSLAGVSLDNGNGGDMPPLEFTYGFTAHPHQGDDSLYVGRIVELPAAFDPDPMPCFYRRGKFVKGSYNDGLIDCISAQMYRSTGVHLYEYCYPDSYPMVFCPSVEDCDTTSIIISEAGFMDIDAVDIDGDGVDEVVKLNCGTTTISGSTVNIKVYKCNSYGSLEIVRTHAVSLPGSIGNGLGHYSPCLRTFRWGDFIGNGKAQLVVANYYDNGLGESQQPWIVMIDLDTGTQLCDMYLDNTVAFASDEDDRFVCLDIDGDSRTEMCFATNAGLMIYRYLNGTITFDKTIALLTTSVLTSGEVFYADINSDGYTDILKAPQSGTGWDLYTNTGTGFVQGSVNIDYKSAGDVFFVMDINRDGYPDVLKANTPHLYYYLNRNGESFSTVKDSHSQIDNVSGILPANVMDYTSMSSFIKRHGRYIDAYIYTSYSPESRHIVQSKDSNGKIVRSAYRYLPHASLNWTTSPTGISASDGYQLRVLPIYVLTSSRSMVSEASDAQVFQQDSYSWYDGVVNTRGLGFCGFSRILKASYLDGIPVNESSYYDPQKTGILTQQKWYFSLQSSNPFRTATYTYDNHSTTYGKLSPRLIQSVTTDNPSGVISTLTYTYDVFDFPTQITTVSSIGSSGAQITSVDQRTYSHSNLPSLYVLGTVSEQSVVMDRDNDLTSLLGERTVYTYDSCFRPITRNDYKAVAYGNPSNYQYQYYLTGKQRWTYDSRGNVLTEESSPYNATGYTGNTYTYDSCGRHLTSSTDALGHTTTYSNLDRYGNPRTVTDYRNRVRTGSFDSWGNLTKTVYADGTVDSTATAWGGQGVYTVTRTITGKPSSIVNYDSLSRKMRTGNRRFNGQWQYTDTEYNERSLVKRVSLPFRSSSPSYWNNYTYDSYNRRTKITEASGRITQWSYTGTSVTETKDGVSVTKTSNAAGDVVNVTDAAGAITYILRDDGQPSSVTAPGSVTTMLTYDNYGRRTSIVDPSAGTRSTSYTYNSDGSSVTTETNALGSIATSIDKYGRITGITRTGTGSFDTEYNYDIYDRLSSVVSTNSTSKEYTYDAYDRISTVKETVPDSKWLQKTYSYGSGGNVSSIAYSTQDGTITTESYSYSNGHNTSIAVTGNTNVITVSSENDFGQPTSATSGSVTRTYEYTAYGFPTKRKMSAGMTTIQDLRTFFNPLTGNLTSRFNARYGQPYEEESFSYDALGRLTSAYDGSITYDIKGNTTKITGVGTMTYTDGAHPYRIQKLNASTVNVTRPNIQPVSYTPYDRPASLSEVISGVTFTYSSDYERVKALHTLRGNVSLKKYYIGDRYEREETTSNTTERLFLGGDAYSAPMVMQRTNNGTWTYYVIGRDYLGSITNLTTTSGTSVAEYSYDAWGRTRNPQTLSPYALTSQPTLLLGRGYCGHEHLSGYGLINMNARLYDPVLGRFLSPDPYVQSPDFSQNFNRYSYALNNPLKYTDESGEFIGTIMTVFLGLPIAVIFGNVRPFYTLLFQKDWEKAGHQFVDSWKTYGEKVSNAFKIDVGLFKVDKTQSSEEQAKSLLSRFTWESPQTFLGNWFSHVRNILTDVNVEYYNGTTLVNETGSGLFGNSRGWGMTLGSYIQSLNLHANPELNDTFAHEYGHTIQSRKLGLAYLPIVGIPSIIGGVVEKIPGANHEHKNEWYEVWANNLSADYHDSIGKPNVRRVFYSSHPMSFNPDWYFYVTLLYYMCFIDY